MTWLAENWFWILTFIAFVAMHLFGHGGHGGASRHRNADSIERDATRGGTGNTGQGAHRH